MYAVHHTAKLTMINIEHAQRRAHAARMRELDQWSGHPVRRAAGLAIRHRVALAGATVLLMLSMVATALASGGGEAGAGAQAGGGTSVGGGDACVTVGRRTLC
ncbi:MAG: hypothetical protein M3295_09455 [Chloroflexota bacterium]|nr:hypothetical protein [Chloroflexota bacterium]